jgi:hypothetical protein
MTGDLTPPGGARTAPTRCSDSAATSPLRHSVPARPCGPGLHSAPTPPYGPGAPARQYDQVVLARRQVLLARPALVPAGLAGRFFDFCPPAL